MRHLINTILPFVIIMIPIAANAQVNMGPCHYDKQTLSNLTCFGPADLEGTTVMGQLIVYGPLTLNAATVNEVQVKGEIHSTSSSIKGVASVYGPLFANNSSFAKDVFSATNYLELTSSKILGNMTEKSSNQIGVIQMTQDSSISGDVDFSDQAGIVKLDKSSQVKGSIKNGSEQPIT